MIDLKNYALLLATFVLSATLAGCNNSSTQPVAAEGTNKICDAIKETGLTNKCLFSNRDSMVGIVIDTNDETARNLCIDIANKIKPLTADLSGPWKLQIYSPYRDDKTLSYCVLH
jgi:hypothetical protein